MGKLTGLKVAGATIGLSVSIAAHADLQYDAEVGVGHSDNITRASTEENDETMATLGLNLSWAEKTRRLEGNVAMDLSYLEYLDNTYNSEVTGTANGILTLSIIPERFTWLFQDSFGQAQVDQLAASTPANRENINYFTTGPSFVVGLGSSSSARLFGQYSVSSFEGTELDADRRSAGVALQRHPNENTRIALNGVTSKVDFDAPTGVDYDTDSAFLSYEIDGPRTDLDAELGYTWLTLPTTEDDGLLARLTLTRDLTRSSLLQLAVAREFTDASASLRNSLEGAAVGGADITAVGDPFETTTASVRWNFTRNRTSLAVGAGYNKDHYETQTQLDRKRMAYDVFVSRRVSPRMEVSLGATYNDEDFIDAELESEELSFQARMSLQFARTLRFSIVVDRSDRSTSTGFGEYVENRAWLTLGLRPQPRGTTAP